MNFLKHTQIFNDADEYNKTEFAKQNLKSQLKKLSIASIRLLTLTFYSIKLMLNKFIINCISDKHLIIIKI